MPVLVQEHDGRESSEDNIAVTGDKVRLYVDVVTVVSKKSPAIIDNIIDLKIQNVGFSNSLHSALILHTPLIPKT